MKKKNIKLPAAFLVIGLIIFVAAFLVENEDLSTALFLIGLTAFFVSLIVLIIRAVKNSKVTNSQVHPNPNVRMLYHSGLRGVEASPVTLELDETGGKIIIYSKPKYCNSVSEISIDTDKITAAGIEKNVTYKPQALITGKMLLGGALFGFAGTMLAAATKKNKKIIKKAYVIHYKDESVPKFIVLKDLTLNKGKEFFNLINAVIAKNQAEY